MAVVALTTLAGLDPLGRGTQSPSPVRQANQNENFEPQVSPGRFWDQNQ